MIGKIDVTVIMDNLLQPLELKTGKHKDSAHNAQVLLYIKLLEDRYKISKINRGYLFYSSLPEMTDVISKRHEIISLLLKRNEIAYYLSFLGGNNQEISDNKSNGVNISYFNNDINNKKDREKIPFQYRKTQLPEVINNEHYCRNCEQQVACFLYYKSYDQPSTNNAVHNNINKRAASASIEKLITEKLPHLNNEKYIEFFQKWEILIDLESSNSIYSHKEIWTMKSKEREKLGTCCGDLTLVDDMTSELKRSTPSISSSQEHSINNNPMIINEDKLESLLSQKGFLYTFEVSKFKLFTKNLLESQINKGDYVTISTERGDFGVAQGIVFDVTESYIKVLLDEELHLPPRDYYEKLANNDDMNKNTTDIPNWNPKSGKRTSAVKSFFPNLDQDLSDDQTKEFFKGDAPEEIDDSSAEDPFRDGDKLKKLKNKNNSSGNNNNNNNNNTKFHSKKKKKTPLNSRYKIEFKNINEKESIIGGGMGDIEDLGNKVALSPLLLSTRRKLFQTNTKVKWRIDKDEMTFGYSAMKGNLMKLFQSGSEGADRLRRLIIDLKEPKFDLSSVLENHLDLSIDQCCSSVAMSQLQRISPIPPFYSISSPLLNFNPLNSQFPLQSHPLFALNNTPHPPYPQSYSSYYLHQPQSPHHSSPPRSQSSTTLGNFTTNTNTNTSIPHLFSSRAQTFQPSSPLPTSQSSFSSPFIPNTIPSSPLPFFQTIPSNLNSDQKTAIKKVFASKDYTLIRGMPGTGKTTTITYIVHLLVQSNHSILITSHTHSAVDNLLEKIIDIMGENAPILRLGKEENISPSIRRFMFDANQIDHFSQLSFSRIFLFYFFVLFFYLTNK